MDITFGGSFSNINWVIPTTVSSSVPSHLGSTHQFAHSFLHTMHGHSLPLDPQKAWRSPERLQLLAAVSDPAVLSELSSELQEQLLEAFMSDDFPAMTPWFAKLFGDLPEESLDKLLKMFFSAYVEKDISDLLKRLSTVLTLQKIEGTIQAQFPDFKNTLAAVDSIATARTATQSDTQERYLKTAGSYTLRAFDHAVEAVKSMYHLKFDSQGEQYSDSYASVARFNSMKDNFFEVWAWAAGLCSTLGYLLGIQMVSAIGIIGGLCAWAYHQYLKPMPDNLFPFKDLVAEALLGKISPVYGRDDEIEEVIRILCGNTATTRSHPLLLGQSGAGKSEIFNGVALRIAKGDVPKQLQGKKLLLASAVDLFTGGVYGPTEKLDTVLRRVRGYESYAIWAIDELQSAFMGEESKKVAQKLKLLLDPNTSGLPFTILATTNKEYEEHIASDAAFVRRVKAVQINPLAPQETSIVLSDQARKDAPDIMISDEVIQMLASLTQTDPVFEGASQPLLGKKLLTQAIVRMRQPKIAEMTQRLRELRGQRSQLEYKNTYGERGFAYSSDSAARSEQLVKVRAEIESIESEMTRINNSFERFQGLIAKRSDVQNTLEREAVWLNNAAAQGSVSQHLLRSFILKYHFYRPVLQEAIEASASRMSHVETALTPTLMGQVIAQEREAILQKRQGSEAEAKLAEEREQAEKQAELEAKYRAKYKVKQALRLQQPAKEPVRVLLRAKL